MSLPVVWQMVINVASISRTEPCSHNIYNDLLNYNHFASQKTATLIFHHHQNLESRFQFMPLLWETKFHTHIKLMVKLQQKSNIWQKYEFLIYAVVAALPGASWGDALLLWCIFSFRALFSRSLFFSSCFGSFSVGDIWPTLPKSHSLTLADIWKKLQS